MAAKGNRRRIRKVGDLPTSADRPLPEPEKETETPIEVSVLDVSNAVAEHTISPTRIAAASITAARISAGVIIADIAPEAITRLRESMERSRPWASLLLERDNPTIGDMRFNPETNRIERYTSHGWVHPFDDIKREPLLVKFLSWLRKFFRGWTW